MISRRRGGPLNKTATVKHWHRQYTNTIREQIAALGMKAPDYLRWYQLINCSAIDNDEQAAGQLHRSLTTHEHVKLRCVDDHTSAL